MTGAHFSHVSSQSSLETDPPLTRADSQSVTSLLNRAGFALSTVDVDEIQIAYPSIYELIDDLKWMGEGNAVVNRRKTLSPETLYAAGEIYKGATREVGWSCERCADMAAVSGRAARSRRWFDPGDVSDHAHGACFARCALEYSFLTSWLYRSVGNRIRRSPSLQSVVPAQRTWPMRSAKVTSLYRIRRSLACQHNDSRGGSTTSREYVRLDSAHAFRYFR